jgi:hypothetical protein
LSESTFSHGLAKHRWLHSPRSVLEALAREVGNEIQALRVVHEHGDDVRAAVVEWLARAAIELLVSQAQQHARS